MTEHVLECRWESQRCICDELRACEQRVLTEQTTKRNSPGGWMDYGYAAGLDAAREAVEGLRGWSPPPQMIITAALDAIDALRNPPSLPPTTGRAHKY